MSDAIEVAAKAIDPLAFAEQGSCPPRGWEHSTPKEVARMMERRRAHAIRVTERVIAAYREASGITRLLDLIDELNQVAHSRGGHDAMMTLDALVAEAKKIAPPKEAK